MEIKFKKLTLCLDMYGCPNRCMHCWIGHSPNGKMKIDDLKRVAKQFKPYTGEATTDYYTGRNGAYREILKAIDILIDNKISPRIQIFVNKNNKAL